MIGSGPVRVRHETGRQRRSARGSGHPAAFESTACDPTAASRRQGVAPAAGRPPGDDRLDLALGHQIGEQVRPYAERLRAPPWRRRRPASRACRRGPGRRRCRPRTGDSAEATRRCRSAPADEDRYDGDQADEDAASPELAQDVTASIRVAVGGSSSGLSFPDERGAVELSSGTCEARSQLDDRASAAPGAVHRPVCETDVNLTFHGIGEPARSPRAGRGRGVARAAIGSSPCSTRSRGAAMSGSRSTTATPPTSSTRFRRCAERGLTATFFVVAGRLGRPGLPRRRATSARSRPPGWRSAATACAIAPGAGSTSARFTRSWSTRSCCSRRWSSAR